MARHSGWHWQSADRVVTGYDPIETGLGPGTALLVGLRYLNMLLSVCVNLNHRTGSVFVFNEFRLSFKLLLNAS